jgi:hypothetical protein
VRRLTLRLFCTFNKYILTIEDEKKTAGFLKRMIMLFVNYMEKLLIQKGMKP